MTLGQLIKAKRWSVSHTRAQVAAAAGTTREIIAAIEADGHEPGIVLTANLAHALTLPISNLATAALRTPYRRRSDQASPSSA